MNMRPNESTATARGALRTCLALMHVLGLAALAAPALAQTPPANLLVNGGFEVLAATPPTTCGNNYTVPPWPAGGYPISPWVMTSGNSTNLVAVDGNVTCNYGNSGPATDAEGTPAGTRQHYLDLLADGVVYQGFTVAACPGSTVPRNTPAPSRAATVAPPAPARSRSCRVPAWVVPSWPASPPPVPATRGGPLSAARWPWRRATTATSALHQPDQLRQRRGQPDPVPGSASGAGRGAGQCALGTAAGGVGRGLAGASPLLARLKHAPPVGFSCRPLATAARRARRARHWRGTP